MSKAILMSINPRWCELIARGEKTIEIRKTIPVDLRPPFKVYIYMTAGNAVYPVTINGAPYTCSNNGGKTVIGEFTCGNIDFHHVSDLITKKDAEATLRGTCLTKKEVCDYIGYKFGDNIYAKPNLFYGWEISDLVIYERAKSLRKFNGFCREAYKGYQNCDGCEHYYCENNESSGFYEECQCGGVKPLTRPPQSWCYVEEVEHHD